MSKKRDVAILGFVRHGEREVPGVVTETAYPVDDAEEDRILQGDG